ncbi:hypothetical protein SAMN04489724_0091 [Algoriphagus locisalis]|uniref:Terpene synthase n=1 Tax=Algoriphagus locisalis TaxID=305507 RepID=A0A1I7E5H8_9BACT|nr:hypothetical protein [Algoriphagus locisalis]SFU19073.1 hypothetical protein SAMN04489724_0091 [Algoriphagus locisalis]
MNDIGFHTALQINTKDTDDSVLTWAETWLVNDAGEIDEEVLERFRSQRLNWFACYLFPMMETNKLDSIAKLFFCMFLLDDLLDLMEGEEAESLLEEMTQSELKQGKHLLSQLGLPIDVCYEKVLGYFSSDNQKARFNHVWDLYVAGLQWEINNKNGIWKLTLENYQEMRPHSSGVFIAIELLREDRGYYLFDTNELENDIARFICLSNDLISASKEYQIADRHNEVLLLSEAFGQEEAVNRVMGELAYLNKKIIKSSQLISSVSKENKSWVDSLLLLLGGCLYWSGETERYADSGD